MNLHFKYYKHNRKKMLELYQVQKEHHKIVLTFILNKCFYVIVKFDTFGKVASFKNNL
jgi:hypothetical protein